MAKMPERTWADFFHGVQITPHHSFEYFAENIPPGSKLDYSVLFQSYKGSTVIDRMIDEASRLGNEKGAEALRSLSEEYATNGSALLTIPVAKN